MKIWLFVALAVVLCGAAAIAQGQQEPAAQSEQKIAVEVKVVNILASVRNGVNVLQSNLESGLAGFESGSFDYVVLSQTLPAGDRKSVV